MNNKEIQSQRMKGYFIQATKEILKGEGLSNVSVRNIASQAGYSYATLYNYFKDAKDLVFECVKDFQTECEQFVHDETQLAERGRSKIKLMAQAYIKYFIQYPGIFELFFIEKTHDLAGRQPTVQLIATFFDRLCETEWAYCIAKTDLSTGEASRMKASINYVVLGMLLLYLTRRHPATYKEFNQIVDEQLTALLKL